MEVATKTAPKTGASRSKKPTSRVASGSPGNDDRFFVEQAKMFDIASQAVRLRILWILGEGETNVTEICEKLGARQPAISHHMSLMRAAQYVESRQEGKARIYSLTESGEAIYGLLRTNRADRS